MAADNGCISLEVARVDNFVAMSTFNGNAGGVGGPVVGTSYVAELGRVMYASPTDDDAIARLELPKCLS